MNLKTIKKAIDINAPKEKLWDVLMQDKYTTIWFAEFGEGTHAKTDWKVGSKAIFCDNTGSGLVGRIIVNKPYEVLSIEYDGFLTEGKEDLESEGAKGMKGGRETYLLSGENGVTHVSIASDMGEEYFEMMSASWDRALQKIKELSEAK